MQFSVVTVAAAVVALAGGTAAGLAAPDASYNVLMLLPTSSRSHRNVFMPLATALVDRGHKVCSHLSPCLRAGKN